MNYLAVKDLKKTRELWELLEAEKELIITRDGRPCAILVGISPDMADDSVREIRRGLFALAVRKARQVGRRRPIAPREVNQAVAESRTRRGDS